mmetsp:Transcript_13902/g.21672  ORF Transcript_13902/g.21672 Transcript_13902/m.21672 type:complete len:164 (+) Transcript_13902:137-628(+)
MLKSASSMLRAATKFQAAPALISSSPLRTASSSGVSPLAWAPSTLRSSYFSGSHYDTRKMERTKNPALPDDREAAEAAVRIFGTARYSDPHARSIRKVLMAPLKGHLVASYYPEPLRHNWAGYKDPHRERAESKLERLKRRGKGPPKKGQGKRATTGAGKKKK